MIFLRKEKSSSFVFIGYQNTVGHLSLAGVYERQPQHNRKRKSPTRILDTLPSQIQLVHYYKQAIIKNFLKETVSTVAEKDGNEKWLLESVCSGQNCKFYNH